VTGATDASDSTGASEPATATADAGAASEPPASEPAKPAAKPDAAKPDAAKPDPAKPDAAKPDAAKPDAAKKPGRKAKAGATGTLEIELESARKGSLSWALGGTVIGCLLIWKLGTVGVWGGFVLVAIGLFHAWQLSRSLRHPPGTIIVSETEVVLPRGVCVPNPVRVTPDEVTAAYFLRRSVPWNQVAPVLVVEIGDRAMTFPHNWFASEADQRHVIHALLRGRPGLGRVDADDTDAPEKPAKADGDAA